MQYNLETTKYVFNITQLEFLNSIRPAGNDSKKDVIIIDLKLLFRNKELAY